MKNVLEQRDLFGAAPPSAAVLREEEHFGRMDAITGMGARSYYSERLSLGRLDAYMRGWREGRKQWDSSA